MSEDLKPCPFCGREPDLVAIPYQWTIVCKCGARMLTVNQGQTQAAIRAARKRCADKWNTRCVEGECHGECTIDVRHDDAVDRDALLALADEIEDYADGDGARFGRLIDRDRAKGYAHRIREALGVVE